MQEQRLRQAAIELVSYLQTARARAMREADDVGQACELELKLSQNVVEPTKQTNNVCHNTPALDSIDLKLLSGIKDLSISGDAEQIFFTFTRQGFLASSNLSSSSVLMLPRIIYLSTSSSQMQRCVLLDLASIRMGYRSSTAQKYCTFNGN